jgi:hypothetical protein
MLATHGGIIIKRLVESVAFFDTLPKAYGRKIDT